MPKAYEKIRDKMVAKGVPLAEAKTHAAKIYNSVHKDNPVTRKEHPVAKARKADHDKVMKGLKRRG